MISPRSSINGLGLAVAGSNTSEDKGFDLSNWIGQLTTGGLDILRGRYGTPAGQYTRYDPATGKPVVVYNSPTGSTTPVFGASDLGASVSANAGGINSSTLLLLGGGLLVVMLMMNRR